MSSNKKITLCRISGSGRAPAARVIVDKSPQAVFCYVSGQGTDSSEKGRQMWARVKGRLENTLLALGFGGAYMFRPGFIRPGPGITPPKGLAALYAVLGPVEPFLRFFFAPYMTRTESIGDAMLNATRHGYPRPLLENRDIDALASGAVNERGLPRPGGCLATATRLLLVGSLLFAVLAGAIVASGWAAFGHGPDDVRQTRMEASPQWRDGVFHNANPLWNDLWASVWASSPDGFVSTPREPVPVVRSGGSLFQAAAHLPSSG